MGTNRWHSMQIVTLAATLILASAGRASALSFTFSDDDYLGGASWGTMDIVVTDSNTLAVTYAASASIPSGSQATAFAFATDGTLTAMTNPADGAFSTDQDGYTWKIYSKDSGTLPQLANADEFSPQPNKNSTFWFDFAATEGAATTITPPGVLPGQTDVFYLDFTGTPDFTSATFDLAGFVDLTGVRLQSLPTDINGGSLFLGGQTPTNPVPEPSTMLLLSMGILGLGLMRRKKIG